MSDPSPALDQIGNNTALTAKGDTPSAQFISLWNLKLSLFITKSISRALQVLPYLKVFRSKPDGSHSSAIFVDSDPMGIVGTGYTLTLELRAQGVPQLSLRSITTGPDGTGGMPDNTLVFYKIGSQTVALEFSYDGKAYKIHPDGGIASLNLDDAVGAFQVKGQQVVAKRQPNVLAPTGGTVVDVQARAQLTALLTALRVGTGHGLIGDNDPPAS